MPYFINVGRFKGLKGVMGARGWHISRRMKNVSVRWGPIEVRNGRPKRIIWAGRPTVEEWPMRTVEAVKRETRRRISEKQSERRANGDKAYQKLPHGQKIRARPRPGK
jgi:hypothetical protein